VQYKYVNAGPGRGFCSFWFCSTKCTAEPTETSTCRGLEGLCGQGARYGPRVSQCSKLEPELWLIRRRGGGRSAIAGPCVLVPLRALLALVDEAGMPHCELSLER